MNNFYNDFLKKVKELGISENDENQIKDNIRWLMENEINILITGPTGCGKSSTINALFKTERAKVGYGSDPETMDVEKYELENMVLWDTPGLGDGKEADLRHKQNIINKLREVGKDGRPLVDLVLVILDGSTRDLGTSYELINDVIIPNLQGEKDKRILVAINQADMAMKGRNWNYEKNEPTKKLVDFLDEKVDSIRKRIYEATGVLVHPIYYSAGYKENENDVQKPYNLKKLMYYILKTIPTEKRLSYYPNINKDHTMWVYDDGKKDYGDLIKNIFSKAVIKGILKGVKDGSERGRSGGIGGIIVGGIFGGIIGGVRSFLSEIFG
ncbi:GTPase family protein [Eubacterium oxidoreducens]|uniref:G domain-containing protein n=1 Tax=Eubacterium oxidoreducens TaxID=1732 RepID=A0A1G6AYY1_EUBOX|nr:ATPase, T2SS/T4P/T4SS family [Eubacterium oxidoreducens]SDB13607.1 hypothetical protein SAMN02910417_01044 [Eubacterium oxidoreducens]